MTLSDGLQCIAQGQIAAEVWFLEIRSPATPIFTGHLGNARGCKAVREQAGLHGAVANHSGVVIFAPGNFPFARNAIDQ